MNMKKNLGLVRTLAILIIVVSLFGIFYSTINVSATEDDVLFTPINDANLEESNDNNFEEHLTIYFFWGDGCPYCELQKEFLEEVEEKYPEMEIKSYEVWFNQENQAILREFAERFGVQATGVPITFIGEDYWVGFSPAIERDMIETIESCISECQIDEERLLERDRSRINLPLFGEIDFSETPLIFPTLLIAFVDGFNPCSLWVLTFLLGIVIYSGSKKKILAVGLTYLFVTATVYGIFIVGLLNIFMYVGFLDWIRYAVAAIALTFAIVNIKDFFWYKKGISFTISDKYKPKLFKKIRNIMRPDNSIPAMIGATALMALGITLVELPCTAGFPVIWSNLVAAQNPGTAAFVTLLLAYLLVYLSVELVIFFGAVFAMKQSRFEKKHGRLLKLIGGMIMLALAIMLAVDPKAMEDIGVTILVFGGAIFLSIIIYNFYVMYTGDKALDEDMSVKKKEDKESEENKEDTQEKEDDNASEHEDSDTEKTEGEKEKKGDNYE